MIHFFYTFANGDQFKSNEVQKNENYKMTPIRFFFFITVFLCATNASVCAHPAADVPAQLLIPVGQRHAAMAAGDVPHPVLELAGILGADAKLAAVALEQEAEELDSVRAADAALLADVFFTSADADWPG